MIIINIIKAQSKGLALKNQFLSVLLKILAQNWFRLKRSIIDQIFDSVKASGLLKCGCWQGKAGCSVTRLGNFYKFLISNCLTKVAQIFRWIFGLFLIMSISCKKCVNTFGAFWGEIRQLFNLLSGHTGRLAAAAVKRKGW